MERDFFRPGTAPRAAPRCAGPDANDRNSPRQSAGAAAVRYELAAGLPLLRKKAIHCRSRRRFGEQEALHLVAAGQPQQHALLFGLDAFAQDRQAARTAERDDRLDDDAAIGGGAERGDEAAVDLELVEREAVQLAEIGVPRAEIVARDAHAK